MYMCLLTLSSISLSIEEIHPYIMKLPPPRATVGMAASGFSVTDNNYVGQKVTFSPLLPRVPCITCG